MKENEKTLNGRKMVSKVKWDKTKQRRESLKKKKKKRPENYWPDGPADLSRLNFDIMLTRWWVIQKTKKTQSVQKALK